MSSHHQRSCHHHHPHQLVCQWSQAWQYDISVKISAKTGVQLVSLNSSLTDYHFQSLVLRILVHFGKISETS